MLTKLLVVDDSTTIQKVMKITFSKYDMDVQGLSSYVEAVSEITKSFPDCLIIDSSLFMSRKKDFLDLIAGHESSVVLLVGSYEGAGEAEISESGISRFVKKPFESGEIVKTVEEVIGRSLTAPVSAPSATIEANVPPPPPPPNISSGANEPQFNLDLDADTVPPPPPPPIAVSSPEVDQPDLPPVPDFSASGSKISLGEGFDSPDLPPPPPIALSSSKKGRPTFGEPVKDLEISEKPKHSDPFPDQFANLEPTKSPIDMPAAEIFGLSQDEFFQIIEEKVRSNLGAAIDQDLSSHVKEAVESYCHVHFSSLAKEVIKAEIRRLADERARYLVDN
jgi:CheY-like chemotaxis protein